MYKKKIPNFNKENFLAWKSLMKLHLSRIGDSSLTNVTTRFVEVTEPRTTQQLREKREHNQEMLEIAFALSYSEFDDIKEWTTTNDMWDTLKSIYGGDKNVLRVKLESLRGKFEEMRMMEGENIVQYCERIKEVVNAIRRENGKIDDEIVINKVLRTLLPIYVCY